MSWVLHLLIWREEVREGRREAQETCFDTSWVPHLLIWREEGRMGRRKEGKAGRRVWWWWCWHIASACNKKLVEEKKKKRMYWAQDTSVTQLEPRTLSCSCPYPVPIYPHLLSSLPVMLPICGFPNNASRHVVCMVWPLNRWLGVRTGGLEWKRADLGSGCWKQAVVSWNGQKKRGCWLSLW